MVPYGRPLSPTKLMPSICVVLARTAASIPGIFRITVTPAVRMSMLCPLVRSFGKRSMTVTFAPALANQYAADGPAIDAPTMRTFRADIVFESFLQRARGPDQLYRPKYRRA